MCCLFKHILFVSFLLLFFNVKAANEIYTNDNQLDKTLTNSELCSSKDSSQLVNTDTVPHEVKFKRGKAILFTIFTGFLGGHRIYLGTHQRTPIIYSATLGGLGILPIIDLIHIIFTKNLSVYENKTQIIMWAK